MESEQQLQEENHAEYARKLAEKQNKAYRQALQSNPNLAPNGLVPKKSGIKSRLVGLLNRDKGGDNSEHISARIDDGIFLNQSYINMTDIFVDTSISDNNGAFLYIYDSDEIILLRFDCDICQADNNGGNMYFRLKNTNNVYLTNYLIMFVV